MRAVIQRVLEASVKTGGVEASRIGRGLLVLLGVGSVDSEDDGEFPASVHEMR
jgi:D-Tyr-tRNAtyr deacylase